MSGRPTVTLNVREGPAPAVHYTFDSSRLGDSDHFDQNAFLFSSWQFQCGSDEPDGPSIASLAEYIRSDGASALDMRKWSVRAICDEGAGERHHRSCPGAERRKPSQAQKG